jgi:hypothetical protein
MLGSASTQQFFASANSIAAVPNVWAEWNYNAFVPPYLTVSTSSAQLLDPAFNSTSSWTNVAMGTNVVNTSITATASGIGISNVWEPTASALAVTLLNKLENKTTSVSDTYNNGDVIGAIKSKNFVVNGGTDKTGFYKFVFYVKSAGTNYSSGFPSKILGSAVTATTTSSAGLTASYYYRVVGITSDGISLGPDIYGDTDVKSVVSSQTNASVTLRWTADQNAAAYRIYKSINNVDDTTYLTTINSSSYVDDFSKNILDSYSPAFFNSNAIVTPVVSLVNSSGSSISPISFVKTSLGSNGPAELFNGSVEAKLDAWTKIEVWFGIPSTQKSQAFSKINLLLGLNADYEKSLVYLDNIELYNITEHDYFQNSFFSTDSAFKTLRPGEALVNTLLPTKDKTIRNFSTASVSRQPSFAFKTPSIYIAKEKVNPQIQMLPLSDDAFQYYISDSSVRSIQAKYSQYLSVNKIVIKHLNTMNTLQSGSLILWTSTTASSVIPMTGSFSSNGCTVLYYNGSTWSTTPWTSPPSLSTSATFQNVISQFCGMSLITSSVSQSSNYIADSNGDFNKIHIIEFSPRLEINLTDYLLSYNVKKEISSGQSAGFPFSYLNSNSGGIEFSNIPVYSGTNAYSVFENSANSGTFTDLLRQGIKISCFLSSPSFQKDFYENIPQFVMYTNQWSVNDIDTVSVDLYDFTKNYLQVKMSPKFMAYSSDLFDIVTTLLAVSGVSDYDYDSLFDVCSKSSNTSIFWSDENKTVMENLQDLFIIHQIGGYTDEYGMLRFKNINQIYNDINSASLNISAALTDRAYTISNSSGSFSYIPNIIPDSYRETINEKVGTIQVQYQLPYTQTGTYAYNSYVTRLTSDIWEDTFSSLLGMNYCSESISQYQTYISFGSKNIFSGGLKTLGAYTGYGLIGSEFIGYDGVEMLYTSPNNNTFAITKIVKDSEDSNLTAKQILDQYPSLSSVVKTPTGRVVGVKRGLFGTKAQYHPVINKKYLESNFTAMRHTGINGATNSMLGWDNTLISASHAVTVDSKSHQLQLKTTKQNEKIMICPNEKSNDYNVFAIDFFVPGFKPSSSLTANGPKASKINKPEMRVPLPLKAGETKKDLKYKVVKGLQIPFIEYADMGVGIFFNKAERNSESGAYCVEIRSYQKPYVIDQYYVLKLYYFTSAGNKVGLTPEIPLSRDLKVFDGLVHRLAISFADKSVQIAVDGKVVVSTEVARSLKSDDAYFGAYILNRDSKDQSAYISISEIYADKFDYAKESALSYPLESRYVFTTPQVLTDILNNKAIINNGYLFQAYPRFQGVKFYDTKYKTKPVLPSSVKIRPIVYGGLGADNKFYNDAERNILGPIRVQDICYSKVVADPFGAKFMIVNNSEEQIILSKSDNPSQSMNPIALKGIYQLTTQADTLTSVINPGYQNSVTLQSQWFSSKNEVEKMISTLSKAMNTFYQDIDITMFANPLIQVGDYISLIYTLKGVGIDKNTSANKPVTCLVTSVSQGWGQGGENTEIVLKPILY